MSTASAVQWLGNPSAVPCAICGSSELQHDEGHCSRCMAPMELSRSIIARGTPARCVSVLGASGAGKTVYLGMLLDVLSKGAGRLRGLPNGSFSLAVQQDTISSLEHRHFPEKTPSEADHWRWVHCEVTWGGKSGDYLDLVTPDLAGEAIALEVDHPGTYPTIWVVVRRSTALLILIDSLRARDAGREEDLFAMKLLTYACSLHANPSQSKRRKLSLPVAFVFTKSDLCPDAAQNAAAFAAASLPGLLQLCERNLEDSRFFAASIVGSTATLVDQSGYRLQIPLHVEPRSVVEPLHWIIERLKR